MCVTDRQYRRDTRHQGARGGGLSEVRHKTGQAGDETDERECPHSGDAGSWLQFAQVETALDPD
jgi:hypothetical protein